LGGRRGKETRRLGEYNERTGEKSGRGRGRRKESGEGLE